MLVDGWILSGGLTASNSRLYQALIKKVSNFLVIGGSGGIGHQLIHDLAPFIILVGKHINDINLDSEYQSLLVDATNSDSVLEFINKGIELFGKVDGIINLAGNLILKPNLHCH